jgi:hypothetical protein
MTRKPASLLIALLLPVISCFAQNASEITIPSPYVFPLKTVTGARYLVDQHNTPFFWSGDAAWSLMAQLNFKDAEFYLENRKIMGFSVVMVSLIEHKFCKNAPANIYGEAPFSGKPFVKPNSKYFSHADSVIESAAKNNILVLLTPLYLGYDCGDEGWCQEVKNASIKEMRSWGKYVGDRYKKYSNIIWLIGGDTDPSPVKEKVAAMVDGIRSSDTVHLFSAHNQPESMAVSPWSGESWLAVNNVYSYDSLIYQHYRVAYEHEPVMPYNQIESAYENEHNSTPQEVRSYAYWAVLSGAMGHVFGNCPLWNFDSAKSFCTISGWKEQLNNQGSMSMDFLQRLFRSRSWQTLVPDFGNQITVSGYGKPGTKDHVASAVTTDGRTIISYMPTARTVKVDMSKIGGSKARCWWYNPSDGKITGIGVFPNSGYHEFTPPASGDWVLVIEDSSSDFSSPGTE